jgi:hypothetical protein
MPEYPVTSKDNSRRIRMEVRRVFLQWDPIGVNDEPNAQYELDGYIGGAMELLFSQSGDAAIAEYLDLTVQHMGMDASRESLEDVVEYSAA